MALAGHLLGEKAAKAPDKAPVLYDALCRVLNLTTPWPIFAKTANGKLLLKNEKAVTDFINQVLKPERKVETLACMSHMLILLKFQLLEQRITPSAKPMVSNLNRMAEVFERNYPGYINSGLAPLVRKSIIGEINNESAGMRGT